MGRKRAKSYRLVVMENNSRRDGRSLVELGYYNPISKQSHFDVIKIRKWLKYGVQPTKSVSQLLQQANLIKIKKKQLCNSKK